VKLINNIPKGCLDLLGAKPKSYWTFCRSTTFGKVVSWRYILN